MTGHSCSDGTTVGQDFLIGLMVVTFFATALLMWVMAWVLYDRPVSMVAIRYCSIFAAAGVVTLVLWRIAAG